MIEISNCSRQKISNVFVVETAEKVLAGEKAKDWDISIVFVGCAKIKELNKTFRKINSPTDVLSFAGLEVKGATTKVGQIIVCPKEVIKNAKENKTSLKREMSWAIVHSVLHLLGYTHEESKKDSEKMCQKEEKYL